MQVWFTQHLPPHSIVPASPQVGGPVSTPTPESSTIVESVVASWVEPLSWLVVSDSASPLPSSPDMPSPTDPSP